MGTWAIEKSPAALQQMQEAQQEIILQQKLLHQRPDSVPGKTKIEDDPAKVEVQRVEPPGGEHRNCGQQRSDADDPQRAQKSPAGDAELFRAVTAQDSDDQNGRNGKPIEEALRRIRRPDHGQNQAVTHCELNDGAHTATARNRLQRPTGHAYFDEARPSLASHNRAPVTGVFSEMKCESTGYKAAAPASATA